MSKYYYYIALFFIYSCKNEYTVPFKSSDKSLLVVEGALNANGITNVKLTKTFKLADTAMLVPELNAQLLIEGKNGSIVPMYEVGDGIYKSDAETFTNGVQYRLNISTANGKNYVSDYTSVRDNPDIDSVEWEQNSDGLQLSVSTHNSANNTRFYRWEYEETWEIHSAYYSFYKLQGGYVVARDAGDSVFTCWKYNKSSDILLGTSAQLAADIISEKPLLLIGNNTERLGYRYSVLVRQYGLDEKSYKFYELIKKNTESIGSIFDAQPTELIGNIHSLTNPEEIVVGYITACPIKEKRIFISKNEVPGWAFLMQCSQDIVVPNTPDGFATYFSGNKYWPYDWNEKFGITVISWKAALPECTDCTLRGGNNQKPTYW